MLRKFYCFVLLITIFSVSHNVIPLLKNNSDSIYFCDFENYNYLSSQSNTIGKFKDKKFKYLNNEMIYESNKFTDHYVNNIFYANKISDVLNKENFLSIENIIFDENYGIGFAEDISLLINPNIGYIEANRAEFIAPSKINLYDLFYTGCLCRRKSWYVKSEHIHLDLIKNEGVIKNGLLYFYNKPIFIIPYLSFPLKHEPRSGFLFPNCGFSIKNGIEFELPYYLVIRNNMDATFTPIFFSKRGIMLASEFRYYNDMFHSLIEASYIKNDKITREDRWFYRYRQKCILSSIVKMDVDLLKVSDPKYFIDFSPIWSQNKQVNYLPQSLNIRLSNNNIKGHIRFCKNQIIKNDELNCPTIFDRTPEILFNGNWKFYDKLEIKLSSNFVNIRSSSRKNDLFDLNYGANRLQFYPSISYLHSQSNFYIKTKIGFHHSNYLHGSIYDKPLILSRTIPIASLDLGILSDKKTIHYNKSKFIIDPKFFYLYIPYKDQTSIPCYDTFLSNFDFSQLFEENIYNGGWDRIANANQIDAKLAFKFLSDDSFEKFSFSVGKRFFINHRKVFLPKEYPHPISEKNILSSIKLSLGKYLILDNEVQYDYIQSSLARVSMNINFSPNNKANLYFGYKNNKEYNADMVCLNHLRKNDIVFAYYLPLSERLHVLGKLDYSFLLDTGNSFFKNQYSGAIESLFGLEYKKENCWLSRIAIKQYSNHKSVQNISVLFQIEFSGLGSLGVNPISIMKKNITGYCSKKDMKQENIFEM